MDETTRSQITHKPTIKSCVPVSQANSCNLVSATKNGKGANLMAHKPVAAVETVSKSTIQSVMETPKSSDDKGETIYSKFSRIRAISY